MRSDSFFYVSLRKLFSRPSRDPFPAVVAKQTNPALIRDGHSHPLLKGPVSVSLVEWRRTWRWLGLSLEPIVALSDIKLLSASHLLTIHRLMQHLESLVASADAEQYSRRIRSESTILSEALECSLDRWWHQVQLLGHFTLTQPYSHQSNCMSHERL